MTDTKKSIEEQLQELLKGFMNLKDTAEKLVTEELESKSSQQNADLVKRLSCTFSMACSQHFYADPAFNYMALLDISSSYGRYIGMSKKEQLESFERMVVLNDKAYEKNKDKIDAIKKIIKGE